MRARTLLLGVAGVAVPLAVPYLAYAAIPFFGPIVPAGVQQCAAGFGALVQVINNVIAFAITMLLVFIAPLMIGYAGFLYVVNPINPANKAKAKQVLINAIVGLLVSLVAWLAVDAVMAALYHPTDSTWGTWYTLVSGNGDACLLSVAQLNAANSTAAGGTGTGSIQPTGVNGATGLNTYNGGTGSPCDASTVMDAASQGGYTLTTAQANTLACIAGPESSCGAQNQNYNWGNGSSAAGAFQVTLQGNSDCYNNSVCEAAAGVSGPLNCASAFSGGNVKSDAASQTLASECLQAAGNTNCSIVAAACVLQKQGFSAWTADPHSSIQQNCINTYQ